MTVCFVSFLLQCRLTLIVSVFCCSVPLKKWKCSFEETVQLHTSVSDWLPEIASVFSGSVFFSEIHAYVTTQRDTSAAKNHDRLNNETDMKWSCDDKRNSYVCHVSDSDCSAVPGCSQSTDDSLLTAVSLPLIVEDSAAHHNLTMTASVAVTRASQLAATVNTRTPVFTRSTAGVGKRQKSASASKKTRRHKLPSSEVQPANSVRESRRTKAVVGDSVTDELLTTGSCISAHSGNTQHSTAEQSRA